MGVVTEILIVALLIIANGAFAMAEIAVVSARKERLQGWVDEGRAGAAAALALANDPNRFLSTVQIGITLVGILAGAFGGATIAARLSDQLDEVAWLSRYSDAISFGIVVVLISYLTLVVGELLPKRLGLRAPERIASSAAPPMKALSTIAAPAVILLSWSTDALLRLLRSSGPVEQSITEEEIKVLMREGLRAGSIEAGEQQMVSGVFRLHDRPVRAFMTLRQDIVWFDVNDSVEQMRRKIEQSRHSRLPVCEGDLENVVGMAAAKDLLAHCLAGDALDLRKLAGPTLFIPETSIGSEVLNMFAETDNNAGLVIDENGAVEGIVTLDDILGEISGGIAGEDEAEIIQLNSSWVVNGRVGIDELEEALDTRLVVPEEEHDAYHTVGGFMMARLGQVPSPGDSFTWSGLKFRVERMDGNRVKTVAISKEQPLEPDAFVD